MVLDILFGKNNTHIMKDIENFVRTARSADCDIDLVRGRYVIDAKSIMGIYSLDVSQPVSLVIHSDDTNIAEKFNDWRI